MKRRSLLALMLAVPLVKAQTAQAVPSQSAAFAPVALALQEWLEGLSRASQNVAQSQRETLSRRLTEFVLQLDYTELRLRQMATLIRRYRANPNANLQSDTLDLLNTLVAEVHQSLPDLSAGLVRFETDYPALRIPAGALVRSRIEAMMPQRGFWWDNAIVAVKDNDAVGMAIVTTDLLQVAEQVAGVLTRLAELIWVVRPPRT